MCIRDRLGRIAAQSEALALLNCVLNFMDHLFQRLNLDGPLTAEQQQRLSLFASAVMLPSDKARFAFGRTSRRFTSTKEAQSFFERQRSVWERVGDGMDRALPVVDTEGEEFVIHYTDFDALPRIQTGEEARVLFSAIGWDNVLAAGFDGVMMTRESGAKWVAMHNPHGTVKSVFNLGTFERSSADIRHEAALPREQAFSNWFGSSAAVDEAGKPLVLYHGTAKSFDEFADLWDTPIGGQNFGRKDFWHYLTPNPEEASYYAVNADKRNMYLYSQPNSARANVMPVYASIQTPMVVVPDETLPDFDGISWFDMNRAAMRAVYPVSYTHLTLPTICSV